MTQTHIKLDTAIAAAMIKARDIGVKMLASDCEQILKASGLSDGVSVALKYLRNKIEEYDREYARQDYETGAWEFGSNAQEEYSNSMHELIEEIESLVSLASAPEVSGDAVATLALKNSELQNRVEILEDLLSSAYCIANRNGEGTHWQRFASRLHVHGISPVTAKTFHILPSDEGYVPDRTAQLETAIAERDEEIERLQSYEQGLNGVIAWMKERGLYWQGDHQQEGADFAAILTEHEQQVSAQSDRKLEADKARMLDALRKAAETTYSDKLHVDWIALIAEMEAKG